MRGETYEATPGIRNRDLVFSGVAALYTAFMIFAGGLDLLVTGDMSGDVEGMLVEHAGLRDVELLVAGHHGSASSTSQALLNALQPETAILSVGRDNAYGHPAPETLERLERAGAEIYRTDRDGTVTVRTR